MHSPDARKVLFRATIILINVNVESRSRLMRLLLLFVLCFQCIRALFSSFLSPVNVRAINYMRRVKNYLIIADICIYNQLQTSRNKRIFPIKSKKAEYICHMQEMSIPSFLYTRYMYVNCYFMSKIVHLIKFLLSIFFSTMRKFFVQ